METFKYIVDSEAEGMRIDRYLKRICKEEALGRIFQALRKGDARVCGKKVKEGYRLKLSDEVTVRCLNVSRDLDIYNQDIERSAGDELLSRYMKKVIFENEDFFIVDKDGDIPMHKGTGYKYGLAEIFKEIYRNKNVNFANRLDYETSGLVIGCKNLKFLRYISEKMRNKEVEKRYMAVVHGKVDEESFKIENYLVTGKEKVLVSHDSGDSNRKRCITYYRKAGYIGKGGAVTGSRKEVKLALQGMVKNATILETVLVTGRKHQIRVQLAEYGHPIIGDRKYGIRDGVNKLYLCCYALVFDNYRFEKNKIF